MFVNACTASEEFPTLTRERSYTNSCTSMLEGSTDEVTELK
jgi:hypothetical protein